MYSAEQVAEQLGLHVRTVRGYIRTGRLRAVRIGKQYRIARTDLDTLTGRPQPAPVRPGAVEVSSIAQVDGVGRVMAERLATLVLAGANTAHGAAHPLRIQTIYDEEGDRMRIVIVGDAATTAEVLHLLQAVLESGDGLLDSGAGHA